MESNKQQQNKYQVNEARILTLRKKYHSLQTQLHALENEISCLEKENELHQSENKDDGLGTYIYKSSQKNYSSASFFSIETIMSERGFSLTNDEEVIVKEDDDRSWDDEQHASSDDDFYFQDIPSEQISGSASPACHDEEGIFFMDDCPSKKIGIL